MLPTTEDIKKDYFTRYQNWIGDNLWIVLLICILWALSGTLFGFLIIALLIAPLVIKKINLKNNVSG